MGVIIGAAIIIGTVIGFWAGWQVRSWKRCWLCKALAERVAAQSELLSRKAEK